MTTYKIGFLIFLSGWFGLLISFWKHNIMLFMILTEVMFLGIITTFISLSNISCSVTGQVIALIILTLAAIETAIGLCILVQAKLFINKLSFTLFHTLNG